MTTTREVRRKFQADLQISRLKHKLHWHASEVVKDLEVASISGSDIPAPVRRLGILGEGAPSMSLRDDLHTLFKRLVEGNQFLVIQDEPHITEIGLWWSNIVNNARKTVPQTAVIIHSLDKALRRRYLRQHMEYGGLLLPTMEDPYDLCIRLSHKLIITQCDKGSHLHEFLQEYKYPDLIWAYPGSSGTDDLIARGYAAAFEGLEEFSDLLI